MAYVKEDEEQVTGAPIASTGGASQLVAGSGDAAGGATPKVNRGGSQFGDIARYISQNRQGGERYASQLGNQVINQADQARQKADQDARARLGEAESSFGQAVNANRVPYDQTVVNRVAQDPRVLYSFPESKPQPVQPIKLKKGQKRALRLDPNAAVLDRTQVPQARTPITDYATPADQSGIDAFRQMLQGQYQGPTDLIGQQGYSAAESAIQNVFNAGQGFQPQRYGGSGSGLDSALLRRAGAANILSGAQDIANQENQLTGKNLQSLLSSANTQAKGKADEVSKQTEEGRKAAAASLADIFPGIQKGIGERLEKERSRYNKYAKDLITPQHVARDEDYQKIAALNALLGQNYRL